MDQKHPPKPSGPSLTRCCPRNLQVLPPPRAAHSPPPLQRAPRSPSPKPPHGRLAAPSSAIPHWSTGHLQICLIAPAFPALCLSPLSTNSSPLVSPSSRIAAPPPPPPPPPGCGSPWPGSRQRKFPGPGPAGGRLLSPPLREEAGNPQPAYPTASSAASGDPGFPGCLSFSAAWGWWRERSRPLRPGGHPPGLRAFPACRAVLGICPGAALRAPLLP